MEPIPPTLAPSEKEHMLVPQDECLVNTNDSPRHQWLKADQQPANVLASLHSMNNR
jgi:hypothetical protein